MRDNNMKTENFQIFCQVVETGSFSEVARLNYLTQPAITRKINQLEDMYGTLLFNRDGVKLSLTETGEILYPFAKEIINHEIKSLEEIQTYLGVREQTIRIGASLTIGDYVLPNIIGLFNQ